jgi:restriction system protein
MGSAINAIEQVLNDAGEPLHYKEITRRVLAGGLWQTDGQTPEATISAQLTIHLKKHGKNARFRRVDSGVYAMNDGAPTAVVAETASSPPQTAGPVSFTDAAERVLTRLGHGQPMHYREITAKALELGLIRTSGRTPEATMYASVLEEIQRYRKRGEQPRFHMPGKGMIGLAKSLPTGIPAQVEQHNRKIRSRLHARLMSMTFDEFEELVGVLLAELGF